MKLQGHLVFMETFQCSAKIIPCQRELCLIEVCGLFSHSLLAFFSQCDNFPYLWCSWFCNFNRYIGELFAPVPCNVSIHKISAFHFGPVCTRILRLLATVNNVDSPFHVCVLMHLCASLFPQSLPSLSFSTSNSLKCGPISLSLNQ